MIPAFNHSHVLPPFLGDSPKESAGSSPYQATASELVARLGNTPERRLLLRGLFDYRQALHNLGFSDGFQWLDGSFVEDVEAHEARPPNDIDVVTFAQRPAGMDPAAVNAVVAANLDVFEPAKARVAYGCDAYVVQLDGRPEKLVIRTAYYHSLFSHRRGDNVWKGFLMLPLQSDDADALVTLNAFEEEQSDAAST
ncbi:MAG: hypothetical protein K8R60_18865 [Burkholderiales bacterium]|nr:hypothetical protein [Burkholderiales bacterium]